MAQYTRLVVIHRQVILAAMGLSLGLARAFIGLGSDVSARNTFFVTNAESESVERLLTARGQKWANKAVPEATVDIERLRNEFQTAFKYFKAG